MEMMGTLILLTAEAAEESGFGLNFDILETNLINLAIVVGVVVYLLSGFLKKALADRKNQIETSIKDAEKRKQDAAAALAEQQQNLAQAQTEAARIRTEAESSAQSARDAILAQAEQDIERMRETAAQDVSTQQERVIRELRQRVADLAMQRAEADLRARVNDDMQRQLIDRSIAMLGGR
jgi:F-type H+-transporting ATPase subunit b